MLEDGAVVVADGLAFLGELDAVVFGVAEDGDEAAGFGEEPPDGPGGEHVGLADLTGPVEAEDAGGVVLEDRDLVGAEFDWHSFNAELRFQIAE